MKITALTPTADRPLAFALCEKMMARQTLQPDEWIVADGGAKAAALTMGQTHIHDPRPAGSANFTGNLLNGIARAAGDLVLIIEDDDYYSPTHIETMVAAAHAQPTALLVGDTRQQYYNIAHRCWRTFQNIGASLCQTGMRRSALPKFETIIRQCMARGTYGVDTNLWRSVSQQRWALTGKMTCLGIKGLPGQRGLGIGHRPSGPAWKADPSFAQLRAWIGADADQYLPLAMAA